MFQAHRGPDARGFFIAEKDGNTRLCGKLDSPLSSGVIAGLAHQRLSIIDLHERSTQPISTADGRFTLVFNGEVYNYQSLRKEMEAEGIVFRTTSDTEVVLQAFANRGTDAISGFQGMFAFAVWDNYKRELTLVRDRLGIKPLHYYHTKDYFAFASELQTLAQWQFYEPKIDLTGMAAGLTFGMGPRPHTMFEGIRSLEQGSWMCLRPGESEREPNYYWRLSDVVQRQDPPTTIEEVESTLQDAVQSRLVADVRVGVCLSGGIDSTLMTAMAAKGASDLRAFTLYSKDVTRDDESELANSIARRYEIEHIQIPVDVNDALSRSHDMMYCYQEPFISLSPNYIIFDEISKFNNKVVLAGLGGDELFGGYKYYAWMKWWRLLKTLKPLVSSVRKPGWFGHIPERLGNIADANTGFDYGLAARMYVSDNERNHMFHLDGLEKIDTLAFFRETYLPQDLQFRDDIQAMNYLEILTNVGNHHVHRLDAFSMRFGIEARVPFLDHRLVEKSMSLPSNLKVREEKLKFVLRDIASKYVPSEILTAPKRGFSFPMQNWMKGELSEYIGHQLQDLLKRDVINGKGVKRLLGQWRTGQRSSRAIWQLVALEVWFKQFFDRNPEYLPSHIRTARNHQI